jgi:hypothetical protein
MDHYAMQDWKFTSEQDADVTEELSLSASHAVSRSA